MSNWTMDLDSKIYSIVKSKVSQKIKSKYADLNFTNVQSSTETAKFPNVYIHMLPMVEQGQDLIGQTINAVLATVQVDVLTNTSQTDAKTVIYSVIDELKAMRFDITSMPEFTKENDIFHAVMRARRMIGSGDKL